MDEKICKECDEKKNIEHFRKQKRGENVWFENICKRCRYLKRKKKILDMKNTNKNAYDVIINKRREKDKLNYHKNKEKINNRNNDYYKKNKEKIQKQRKIFKQTYPENAKKRNKKFLENIDVKIGLNLRKRTRYFLHSGKNWSDLLGCTIKHFKEWLQFNFDKEQDNIMNMSNYGTVWEIDHVYPISKYDMKNEEDIKKAFSWKNILPVTCSYNKSKNNKISESDLDKLKNRLDEFNNKLSDVQSISTTNE